MQQPRSFLLDSGANCNLISLQHLTKKEKQTIDKKAVIKITGFNKTSPTTHSLGKVAIRIKANYDTPKLQFHVMPAQTLNYNIIGIHDIRQHFLPNLLASTHKTHSTAPCLTNDTPKTPTGSAPMHCYALQRNPTKNTITQPQTTDPTLTYDQASKLYSEIPTPTVKKQTPPQPLIDPEWFKSLWKLFPRLTMEHENLSEPSRLPHKFFVKLKPDAKPHISPTYQTDKKRTNEMLKFLKQAIADNLIVSVPCQYISASFMLPRADPTKPYRCIIDYRVLNKDTERFDSILPRVDALRHFAANGHIYSKLDISKAFHHMQVDEDTIPLLGFVTPVATYSWRVAPMGTKCTPASL